MACTLTASAHVLMENRHGLCVDVGVDEAHERAERWQARIMLERAEKRHGLWPRTLGADAGYRDRTFLADLEEDGIRSHVPVGDKRMRGDHAAGWRDARHDVENRRAA